MNNQQVEIIIRSLKIDQLSEYLKESFCDPMRIMKENIHNGLKPMHLPLEKEDLETIKKTFLKYEMVIDGNLKLEENLMPVIESVSHLSIDQRLVAKSILRNCEIGHQKEIDVAKSLHEMIDNISCPVYDLIRQLTYKTDDRIDIYDNYLVDLIERSD
ncbi:MAG: hypothetical protein Q8N92_09680 [Erysipelotrichaceae bacterium]|nr:hypothetical protein [Erysipelotrichaceae bacterium]